MTGELKRLVRKWLEGSPGSPSLPGLILGTSARATDTVMAL